MPIDAQIPEDFVMPATYIKKCLEEIELINHTLPFKKKFAWRILNMYDNLVLVPEKIYTDGRPEKTNTFYAPEYFKRK